MTNALLARSGRDTLKTKTHPWLITFICFYLLAGTSVVAFDLQGHRGARGLAPENTLAGFKRAIELGVTTLEMDLAVTKDGVLVISHDTALNPSIVRDQSGQWLSSQPLIRNLTLAEIKRLDVGRIRPWSIYWFRFPRQIPVDGERIPTLDELFVLIKASPKTIRLNMETKLSPHKPDEAPDPETFARLVVDSLQMSGLAARTTIQSFDWRTLLVAKKLAPEIETVCLTTEGPFQSTIGGQDARPSAWLGGLDFAQYGSVPKLVKAAGCGTWSPRWRDLTVDSIEEAHGLSLKIVPWTVNSRTDIERLIAMKVDGVITDYPDRARKVIEKMGVAAP